MRKRYKRLIYAAIALLAIGVSIFEVNVDDAVFTPVSNKSDYSTKTTFNCLHPSSVLLVMEMDSEEAVDGEEDSDDESEELIFEPDPFYGFSFASLQNTAGVDVPGWEASSVKGHFVPIYLINRNFRL